jgi:branched-chain amino acid transport system substrate-binding protein
MQPPALTPLRVGMFYDYPQGDGGALPERAVRLGIADATSRRPLDRPVELVAVQARGLPMGSEHEVIAGFDELAESGVLVIVGPSITDNCLIARERADAHRVPTINYSGGERTRSEWMFHFQIGSLELEPLVIAERCAQRGLRRCAVMFDHSPVGRRYAERFAAASGDCDLSITATTPVPSLAEDLVVPMESLRASDPDVLVYLGLGVASRAVAVALDDLGWTVPVVANSALMFGYARPDWRDGWAGWEYVDQIDDANPIRRELATRDRAIAGGPIGCGLYDIGRLLGTALTRCEHLTRAGVAAALHDVKRVPSATGPPGTRIGFGHWDHAALPNEFLVVRQWRDGRSTPADPIGPPPSGPDGL